jgi:excinuclease UvrABC ATPase subunit
MTMTTPERRQLGATGYIEIDGARQNNLKAVSLRVPKGHIVVFVGVSGSGKSSLVFDTIAAESQRQLNETFSWYVRTRLPRRERPHADRIDNLSAAIVVDQRPVGGNARSTVGTMTEINPILRVLFSRHGQPSAGESNAYSFNDPAGMCPECEGLGRAVRLDFGRLLDATRSLNEGAIRFPPAGVGTWWWQLYATTGLFDPDKPVGEFTPEERDLLLHGHGFKVLRHSAERQGDPHEIQREGRRLEHGNDYEGLVRRLERLYLKRDLAKVPEKDREAVRRVLASVPCPTCGGARVNEAARASRIDGHNIADYWALEVSDLIPTLERIQDPVAAEVAAEALAGLRRIEAIGLGYLSLDRETPTLSGGEGQRLKTVRNLGSSLTGMTYVFDEPSVGLHPRDVHRLNELLCELRDKGNTVLVVEHDRAVIAIADHVVEMGPGAGATGGEVVFEGPLESLREGGTPTGERLRRRPTLKSEVRCATGELIVRDATLHNLSDLTVSVPTGVMTAITGVAGSGKSTLVSVLTTQYPDTVLIDQSGIGISARSTPSTYVGAMPSIRRLFADATGVEASLFSFNSAGACPACQGRGVIRTDLAFMDPVTTTCEVCRGRRYRADVLAHEFRGKSIADVLELTIDQAADFFHEHPVRQRLQRLQEVGLGYLTLGQPLGSLSGGERQRLKLANRLGERGHVYIFDEPTTGMHMADIETLLALLDRLVDAGNTVIAVEHDFDVVEHADWVIDLGPEAGHHGGRVMFAGTPGELVEKGESHTARYLRADLGLA